VIAVLLGAFIEASATCAKNSPQKVLDEDELTPLPLQRLTQRLHLLVITWKLQCIILYYLVLSCIVRVFVCVCVCIYTYIFDNTYRCVCVCVCVCVYTHTHTHTHTQVRFTSHDVE
jgi:hypothetical protein